MLCEINTGKFYGFFFVKNISVDGVFEKGVVSN